MCDSNGHLMQRTYPKLHNMRPKLGAVMDHCALEHLRQELEFPQGTVWMFIIHFAYSKCKQGHIPKEIQLGICSGLHSLTNECMISWKSGHVENPQFLGGCESPPGLWKPFFKIGNSKLNLHLWLASWVGRRIQDMYQIFGCHEFERKLSSFIFEAP